MYVCVYIDYLIYFFQFVFPVYFYFVFVFALVLQLVTFSLLIPTAKTNSNLLVAFNMCLIRTHYTFFKLSMYIL